MRGPIGAMFKRGVLLAAVCASSWTHAELAICTTPQRPDCPVALPGVADQEFTFSRLIFNDNQAAIENLGDRIGYPHWQADCSESEPHFIAAMNRLTRVDTNDQSQSISLLDERLYDYPMLYVVEAGFASFSQAEADSLREYLLRGGFLLVDDFHGSYQWQEFESWMNQVFPDREIVDIPPTHEIFNIHFSIDDFIQIPGLRALCLNPGETWELPIMKTAAVNESNASRQQPRWRGILDDDGRIMVVINWNMDLGDAWEHADMEEYSALYTATAYRLGVNYVIYGMTH
ncbi:MAG: DUF4159 domain-containing protein [Granulosicoccus sp.]|nr:DUF4159 domain-containing protein [Granulosicoccus sp.]